MSESRPRSLIEIFREQAMLRPAAPAVEQDGVCLSYGELEAKAGKLGALLEALITTGGGEKVPVVGLLSERGIHACVGVLGILASGLAWFPLARGARPEKLAVQLRLTGVKVLLASRAEQALAELVLRELPGLQIFFLDELWQKTKGPCAASFRAPIGAQAYILCTSGSTGEPKALGVSHASVQHYLEVMRGLLGLNHTDRCSQAFELSFDLSVHDLFVTWNAGACLVIVPETSRMAPAAFIRESRLTCWFSTPSTISFAQKLRDLAPGTLPGLKQSLFCGEALPVASAEGWSAAAPSSRLLNLYGPAEATIAVSAYSWQPPQLPASIQGLLAIGKIFPGHDYLISEGELLLSGPQVIPRYLLGGEERAFVELSSKRWYRTGDLVEEHDGILFFTGRTDSQWKIRGQRVEAAEVENGLRKALHCQEARALPWPPLPGPCERIFAFVEGPEQEQLAAIAACREQLPETMVPERIFFGVLPRTAHGKINLAALRLRLSSVLAPASAPRG